jgi:uncharacterized membrane protein
MEISDLLQALFRWVHVVAGIVWIGHLYFFNFVNAPFEGTLDGGTKKAVVPQLRPRALFWFRWGAAWTWITGLLLVLLVFYHGGVVFGAPDRGWTIGAFVCIAITFLAFGVYDPLAGSELGKDNQKMALAGFVLTAVAGLLFVLLGGFGYRGMVIHVGSMFGTLMAANVWMRIWPAQQKIIAAIRDGQAPDAALVALAGTRSRHNVYMSVPLVWTMIDQHTTGFNVGPLEGLFVLLVLTAVAWWIVMQLYAKAAAVKGF